MSKFLISAKRDGFWRAGRQWFKTPAPVGRDEFDDDQWERLEADSTIVIEPLDGDPAPDAQPTDLELLRGELDSWRDTVAERDAGIAPLEARIAVLGTTEPTSTSETADSPNGGGPDSGSPPAGDAEPTREERILAAAKALDPANSKHWTQTGKAVIFHLRELSGLGDVTAAERDAAQAAAGVGPAAD